MRNFELAQEQERLARENLTEAVDQKQRAEAALDEAKRQEEIAVVERDKAAQATYAAEEAKTAAEAANLELADANHRLEQSIDAFGVAIKDVLRERPVLVLISAESETREYFDTRSYRTLEDVKRAVLEDAEFPPGAFEVRAYTLDENGEPVSKLEKFEKRIDFRQSEECFLLPIR